MRYAVSAAKLTVHLYAWMLEVTSGRFGTDRSWVIGFVSSVCRACTGATTHTCKERDSHCGSKQRQLESLGVQTVVNQGQFCNSRDPRIRRAVGVKVVVAMLPAPFDFRKRTSRNEDLSKLSADVCKLQH